MWLEAFTLNANDNIALTGVALDNQVFARYVEDLRASNYIAIVDTQRTSRQTVDGLDLVSSRAPERNLFPKPCVFCSYRLR